jgi:serine/threonine-protein kinase RsbT
MLQRRVNQSGEIVEKIRTVIKSAEDIVAVGRKCRDLAENLGFSDGQLAIISAAISEIAQNMIEHAEKGEIVISSHEKGQRRGIVVVARDRGPGIPDIELTMQDAYSSSKGIGLGLPGARRLMDEFDIDSEPHKGTTVKMTKWVA